MNKNMNNPLSVDAIIERCEQFTRDNLPELARELNAAKKGRKAGESELLQELNLKLSMTGISSPPTMQIAIAMISNECVKFVASAHPVDGLRQGNWQHPEGGRIVGWIIEPNDVERMKADAFCLPREVAEALANLRADHYAPANCPACDHPLRES